MPFLESPRLTFDEIDDLLYFTRVNEIDELDQTIGELAQKHNCSRGVIVSACSDSESGTTVLHYCAANGFTDLLKWFLTQPGIPLVAIGAAGNKVTWINSINKQGNTPLHWAAYNGHLEIVKTLVSAGADIWIKNFAGHLAMFEAERAEKSDVVQYLLEAGGDRVERVGAETEAAPDDVGTAQNGESSSANSTADMPNGGEAEPSDDSNSRWNNPGPATSLPP